jgi:D-xylose 1-dehydrogenase (NADP+, D-xylono-1,5-lactone-forming)
VPEIRWGLMGPGQIGTVMVEAAQKSARANRFVAVASRSADRSRVFADKYGIDRSYASYQALLDDPQVDAVYIALPVATHSEWTVAALRAGKHVLCEKPLAVDAAEVAADFDAAEAADRLCVEGLMWRWHPQTRLARSLVDQGAIGTLRSVRAALTVPIPPEDIRRSRALGGGAIGDLGCYCVSAIRLFAGQPELVYATGADDGADVEMRVSATARHTAGVLSQFDIGFDMTRRDQLELIGTDGHITVTDPWICGQANVELVSDGNRRQIDIDPGGEFALSGAEADVYRVEIDTVSAVISGETELEFGREDAIDQIAAIAAVRESVESGNPVALR